MRNSSKEKPFEVLWCPWRRHCCLHYKTLTLPHNSKTVTNIQMKISTYFPGNNIHVYTKSHISGFINYSVMPLFALDRNLYKKFNLAHHSKSIQHFQTLASRNNTHVYTKWYNSGFNRYLVMNPFRTKCFTLPITHKPLNISKSQMKLGTHLPRNKTHVYVKSHNSDINNHSVRPPFLYGKTDRIIVLPAAGRRVAFSMFSAQ